ncbi:restriction endonuclease subunit S (plasmid) [Aeromonas media]|uniref:Restriction endonuclease subunit S n=4 Tax=Aeromonas TaxID=642 RepID=A0ABX6NZV4_AERME|nr:MULTISPECIES: restriction endonuclease subunit S [Aeromonas]QJT41391.1 restriction endonuclease subunit S [Aeromonas media]QLI59219.1 restriction endonuclease subunit S [Aeromonas caviae]QLI60449.1 restriction endonuclease subunit S [Aeromonas caviae]
MSHYKPYPAYRDSGVEWIGQVPSKWEVKPIKIVATFNDDVLPDSTAADTPISYVDISSVSYAAGIGSTEEMLFGNAPSRARRKAKVGDVVISTVRTYLKAVAAVDAAHADCVYSTGFAVLRSRTGHIEPNFLKWLALNELFIQSVESHSEGLSYPAINAPELVNLKTVMPSLPEQATIAVTIDRETARFDALIAKKTRFIELLKEKRQALITHAVTKGLNPKAKMKASGVEWIGEVPEHWAVCKLSYRYSVELGKMLDEKRITGQHPIPYLRNKDVQWDSINTAELPVMDIAPNEHERYTVRNGDLLVCEGGDIGRSAVWRGSDNVIGYQKALHRLRSLSPDKDCVEFYVYVLGAAKRNGVFEEGETKSTISHLPAEKFREYRFAFPPVDEQIEIMTSLKQTLGRIDLLTEKTQRSIDLLRERRAAFITAAVTGQIDLRESA